MVAVGLTGATGHLGGLLLARLLADPQVSEVRSVARRPLTVSDPRLRHVCADLRSPEARRALVGVDVVHHLGFQLWDGGDPAAMAEVNRRGTDNVLASGPAAVVLASSAAVYGAWPGNPVPLSERLVARPNPECPYAAHKLEAERRCLDAAPAAVVVRLAAVLGPHADPVVAKAVAGYRLAVPAVRGTSQAVQFLHEDDAVEALLAAGRAALGGTDGLVCNAATVDWLDADGIASVTGGRVVALPRTLLLGGSRVAHRLGVLPFGADRAVLVCGPLALDPSLAAGALGWAPTRSSRQVLAQAAGRE